MPTGFCGRYVFSLYLPDCDLCCSSYSLTFHNWELVTNQQALDASLLAGFRRLEAHLRQYVTPGSYISLRYEHENLIGHRISVPFVPTDHFSEYPCNLFAQFWLNFLSTFSGRVYDRPPRPGVAVQSNAEHA